MHNSEHILTIASSGSLSSDPRPHNLDFLGNLPGGRSKQLNLSDDLHALDNFA